MTAVAVGFPVALLLTRVSAAVRSALMIPALFTTNPSTAPPSSIAYAAPIPSCLTLMTPVAALLIR